MENLEKPETAAADGASPVPKQSARDPGTEHEGIEVRAKIFCKNCGYSRVFRNRIDRNNMELIVVTFKVLDWTTCPKCNELLSTHFEYDF